MLFIYIYYLYTKFEIRRKLKTYIEDFFSFFKSVGFNFESRI